MLKFGLFVSLVVVNFNCALIEPVMNLAKVAFTI